MKLLVVTDPTKNLLPLSIASEPAAPTTLGRAFTVDPSLNDSTRIASPVVNPWLSTITLLSVTFTVLRVIL